MQVWLELVNTTLKVYRETTKQIESVYSEQLCIPLLNLTL